MFRHWDYRRFWIGCWTVLFLLATVLAILCLCIAFHGPPPALSLPVQGQVTVSLATALSSFIYHLPFRLAIFLPLSALYAIWAIKVTIYLKYGRLSLAESDLYHGKSRNVSDELLPSRRALLDMIINTIKNNDGRRTITVESRWGDGKSFLLQQLEKDLGSQFATVCLDVWEHATEQDLHFAFFEALLRNEHVIFNRRVRGTIPCLSLLLTLIRRALFGLSSRSSLSLYWAEAEFQVPLPRLGWQSDMESIFGKLKTGNRKVVFILDEIDRANPEICQAAVSLTQRALRAPNVFVVMPYVREQMEFKAFNPLRPTMADIQSTMFGVLWKDWNQLRDTEGLKSSQGNQLHLQADWLGFPDKWMGGKMASSSARPKRQGQNLRARMGYAKSESPFQYLTNRLHWSLLKHYLQATSPHQKLLRFAFAEKFLFDIHFTIDPLTDVDIAASLVSVSEIRTALGEGIVNDKSFTNLVWEKIRTHPAKPQIAVPTLRHFKSRLLEMLQKWNDKSTTSQPTAGDIASLATIVYLAYFWAGAYDT